MPCSCMWAASACRTFSRVRDCPSVSMHPYGWVLQGPIVVLCPLLSWGMYLWMRTAILPRAGVFFLRPPLRSPRSPQFPLLLQYYLDPSPLCPGCLVPLGCFCLLHILPLSGLVIFPGLAVRGWLRCFIAFFPCRFLWAITCPGRRGDDV